MTSWYHFKTEWDNNMMKMLISLAENKTSTNGVSHTHSHLDNVSNENGVSMCALAAAWCISKLMLREWIPTDWECQLDKAGWKWPPLQLSLSSIIFLALGCLYSVPSANQNRLLLPFLVWVSHWIQLVTQGYWFESLIWLKCRKQINILLTAFKQGTQLLQWSSSNFCL